MVSEIHQGIPRKLSQILIRFIQINCHELVTKVWQELCIIDFTIGGIGSRSFALLVEFVDLFIEVYITSELLALEFGSFLPAIHVNTVIIHQRKCHHLFIEVLIDGL